MTLAGFINNGFRVFPGKSTAIGTVTTMMLPYSMSFLILWIFLLLLYVFISLPPGMQVSYIYP